MSGHVQWFILQFFFWAKGVMGMELGYEDHVWQPSSDKKVFAFWRLSQLTARLTASGAAISWCFVLWWWFF